MLSATFGHAGQVLVSAAGHTQSRTNSAQKAAISRPSSFQRQWPEIRAALQARGAQAPDDVATRVSLGEPDLSVSLAASRAGEEGTATRPSAAGIDRLANSGFAARATPFLSLR